MPSVSVDNDAFQDLATLRSRIEHEAGDLYEANAQLQFDKLLVRLERESRGIFITLWGDEPILFETDRIDVRRATDDAAMSFPYPIQEVKKVERKRTLGDDWHELDADRWDFTEHRLVLARGTARRATLRGNSLASTARRASWANIAEKLRVTYDRGFETVPGDILSVQVALVNRMVRQLKNEQTVGAASPGELADASVAMDNVVTQDIRDRISDVTSPSSATLSI